IEEREEASDALTVVTTTEEHQGYYIVKAILHGVVDMDRIAMRDVQSYCGIVLDDNNRKPICRLHFNRAQKYLGLFDNRDRREIRVPLAKIDDIYSYGDRIRATVQAYDGGAELAPAQQAEEPAAGE